jgi:hypothetical protein
MTEKNEQQAAGLASDLNRELDVPKKKKTIPEMLRQENREFSLEIKKLNFEVKRLGTLLEKERKQAVARRQELRQLEKENRNLNSRLSTLCAFIANKSLVDVLEVFKNHIGTINAKRFIDELAD